MMYEDPTPTRPAQSEQGDDNYEYDPPTVPAVPPDAYALPPEPPTPVSPPKRQRRSGEGCWGCLRTGLAVGAMALAILFGTTLILGLVIYSSLSSELEEDMAALESLEGVEDFQTSRIYDRDGVLLYEIFEEGRRTEVPLDRIPFAMRWATIATEDDTFYENPGFDPPSILRAAWQWYSQGEIISGGSTITQQLVKQIVFDYDERLEQTLRRKLKEAALAWVMTRQYSKDDILELYLNEIYYGNLAYGVESAADVYFGKHATELTIAECAFLAGMVQSPAGYDPYTDFAAAKVRQREVLDLMVRHGYLNPENADNAFNEPPLSVNDLASPDVSLLAPHFTVEVRRQLAEIPGLDPSLIAQGGLEIHTTIDMEYQALAEQIATQRVAEVRDELNLHNAALVAINPNTGEVLAMLGSIDYEDEGIDGNVNVILSPQQPGSAIKPLTYAAAFEQGWTAADILWDVPMAYDTGVGAGFDYEPVNYDERFHGPVRLRDALANSYNIPAVTLLREVSVPGLLEMGARLGIESLGQDASLYGLSLTLGGGELTPLELTSAFAAFANGGRRVNPYLIARVVDSEGNVLYDATQDPNAGLGEQVLDPRVAFLISNILSDNAARTPMMGANSALLLDFPAAAKTGTTNDFRDNWTIGYTPHLVVGVWAGNTDNSPMAEGTSGLTGAAPIWHDYMTAAYSRADLAAILQPPNKPPIQLGSDFVPPEGMEQRRVCVLSSLRDPQAAEGGCPRTQLEWFLIGNVSVGSRPTDVPTPTASPIPTVVDEEGNPLPPVREEIEAGLWVVGVLPLDEERLQAMEETLTQIANSRPDGAPRPATPLYCEVPPENAQLEGIARQIFIAAPRDPVDAIRARNWALTHGVPIAPGLACPPELIEEAGGGQDDNVFDPLPGLTYFITWPQDGSGVYGVTPIIGTAIFNRADILFYKIEISGGPFSDWTTLGETHSEIVSDDVLEYLHADALPPGEYVIRLVLVRTDYNFLPPYTVRIVVLSEPPTPTPTYTPTPEG